MDETPTAYELFKTLAETAEGPIGRQLANNLIAAITDNANGLNVANAVAAIAAAVIRIDTVVARGIGYTLE